MVRRKIGDRKVDHLQSVVGKLDLLVSDEDAIFIPIDIILQVWQRLQSQMQGDRLFPPEVRSEIIDDICLLFYPTYERGSGIASEVTKGEESEDELVSVTLYSKPTGRTSAEFWKRLDQHLEEHPPDLPAASQEPGQEDGLNVKVSTTSVRSILSPNLNHPEFDSLPLNVPAFQRPFRWRRSEWLAFLDSIRRGIPTPPLLFAKNTAEERWEIIDGQQRIASLLMMLSGDQRATSLGIDADTMDSIMNYEVVIYSIEPTEEYDLERYWGDVRVIFQRLNLHGRRLRPVEHRAAMFTGTTLHTSMMEEVKKVRESQEHDLISRQFTNFLPRNQQSNPTQLSSDAHDEHDITIYDLLTRRLVFGHPQEANPTPNAVIREFFEKHADEDPTWCSSEVDRIRNSIQLACKIFGYDQELGRTPPNPEPNPENNRRRPRRSHWIFCTLTIGLDQGRADAPPRFRERALANKGTIREAWSEFYWKNMDDVNQSSTNVWKAQREWCLRVDEIIGT